MCNVCLKELKGWIKSFTRTEILLSLVEAVLLVIFIGFLIFLIMHFLACSTISIDKLVTVNKVPVADITDITTTDHGETADFSKKATKSLKPTTKQTKPRTPVTVKPGVKCTWKGSQKTKAYIHYFYPVTKLNTTKTTRTSIDFYDNKTKTDMVKHELPVHFPEEDNNVIESTEDDIGGNVLISSNSNRDVLSDASEGEDATEADKQHILALVKLRPPKDITFGCILTLVHSYWVVTAASCLEAVDEVDFLDNFVIMEGYGGDYSKNHAVADVQIHPLYQGANRSYDLAALKSDDSLVEGELSIVDMPELLDYFLMTIGERLSVLGFGSFRTIDKSPSGNSLRQAYVYNLPARQCPVPSDTWSLRTLKPDEPVVHAPCGTAPLCAGVLFTRGTPCNYCAGTPLMQGSVLYGIMSDNQQCGVSCEPQIYVNVAVVGEWLDSVIDNI